MKKKLPIVFVNEIKKKLNNNKTIFYSGFEQKDLTLLDKIDSSDDVMDIDSKINEMFASPEYVYKMGVTILTKSGEKLKKEIIGKIDDKLITIDEDYIMINEIRDIKY